MLRVGDGRVVAVSWVAAGLGDRPDGAVAGALGDPVDGGVVERDRVREGLFLGQGHDAVGTGRAAAAGSARAQPARPGRARVELVVLEADDHAAARDRRRDPRRRRREQLPLHHAPPKVKSALPDPILGASQSATGSARPAPFRVAAAAGSGSLGPEVRKRTHRRGERGAGGEGDHRWSRRASSSASRPVWLQAPCSCRRRCLRRTSDTEVHAAEADEAHAAQTGPIVWPVERSVPVVEEPDPASGWRSAGRAGIRRRGGGPGGPRSRWTRASCRAR
jgi:hypothetical protein